jgi:hypothetical protein
MVNAKRALLLSPVTNWLVISPSSAAKSAGGAINKYATTLTMQIVFLQDIVIPPKYFRK